MGGEGVRPRLDATVGTVGLHLPALRLVVEAGDHDLLHDLPPASRVLDRHQRFDPPVEVAGHSVRRGEEHLRIARRQPLARADADRKSVVKGTRWSARGAFSGRWSYKTTTTEHKPT